MLAAAAAEVSSQQVNRIQTTWACWFLWMDEARENLLGEQFWQAILGMVLRKNLGLVLWHEQAAVGHPRVVFSAILSCVWLALSYTQSVPFVIDVVI